MVLDVQVPGEHEVLISPWGPGRSVRRTIRGAASRLLPAAVATSLRTGAEVDETSDPWRGMTYRVVARPILGPSGLPHAVLCIVVPTGHDLPPAPELGGWEWDVPARTGYSSDELLDTYRVPEQLRAPYSVPQFLARITLPDSPGVLDLWARVEQSTDDELLVQEVHGRSYDEVVRTYRICGRARFDGGDEAGPTRFRGVTIDVTDLPTPPQPVDTAPELLDAVVNVVNRDNASLAIVDLPRQQVVRWLTTPNDLIAWPKDGALRGLVHPDDVAAFDVVTTELASLPLHSQRLARLRMLSPSGTWEGVEIQLDLHVSNTRAQHATVAVRKAA